VINFKGLLAVTTSSCAVAGIVAHLLVVPSKADVLINTHYRCWDEILRVSHGGWVSYPEIAQDNCNAAAQLYPNNNMYVVSEQY
jgi:hypothetical protein